MWRVGHASARVPETLYAFADGAGSTLIWIHANGDGGARKRPSSCAIRRTPSAADWKPGWINGSAIA